MAGKRKRGKIKLFWKQFVGMLGLILLVFSIFSSFLLYSVFRMYVEEEKSRMSEKISMFQYSVRSALNGLPEEYEAIDYAVAQIGESLVNSLGSQNDIVRIYQKKGEMIYENRTSKQISHAYDELRGENACMWQTVKSQGNYYLQSLSLMENKKGNYYVEIDHDITYIYQKREELYSQYRLILLIATLLAGVLSFLFSANFTRPIRQLSRGARRFAAGDYKSRVAVRGNDEVTVLMEDFNHMADRLEKNMHRLRENVRQQEEFTASFAHELKTPLTSIVGYADMLRTMQLSAEEVFLCGDYIFRQGTRLEHLSYKMLELAGMGEKKIRMHPLSVKGLVEKTMPAMQMGLKEKQLCCEVQLEEGTIYADEDLFFSLFCNLLDNSRKACEEFGNIYVKGIIRDDLYILVIEDDGRGIPKEELERIKEAFYMVDKSRARKEGGAGLGMALCDKIVSIHNACWKIESQLGEWTAVTIEFPLYQGQREKTGEGQDET